MTTPLAYRLALRLVACAVPRGLRREWLFVQLQLLRKFGELGQPAASAWPAEA